MSILLSRSFRNIASKKRQSLLIILAVTASAAGLSGFFNTVQNIEESVSEAYAATNQAEIIITTDSIPLSSLPDILECGSVSDAEVRILFNTNLLTGDQREPFILVGVRDFSDMRLNQIQLLEGHYPGKDEVMLEISSAELLHIHCGEQLTLYSVKEPVTLTVSGLGRNPEFLSSSFSGVAVGYTDITTTSDVAGISGGNALYISLKDPSENVDDVLKVLADNGWYAISLEERSASAGGGIVTGTLILIFMLSLFMLVIAIIFTLILFSSLISEQKEDIENMRIVGIGNREIISLYGSHGIILGLVGAVLGVLFGYGITRFLYTFFAEEVLNLEAHIHYNVGVSLLIAVMVSAVSTMLWSWFILNRETRFPGEPLLLRGKSPFNRIISRAPMAIRMAFRDFQLMKGRVVFMVVTLALTASAFVCVQSLGDSIESTLHTGLLENRTYDVVVTFNSPVTGEHQQNLTNRIQRISGVKAVEGWFSFEATVETENIGVFGVPPDSVVYTPPVMEGRWFTDPYSPHECVISEYLSQKVSAVVGDTILIETPAGDQSMTIIGTVKDVDHDGKGVFIPLKTAQEIMHRPEGITRLFLQTDEHKKDEVGTELDIVLSSFGISRIVKTKDDLIAQTQQMTQTLLLLLYGVIIFVVGVCVAVLQYILGNLISLKMGDIVNLKLIGIKNTRIVSAFFVESGIIVLIAWVLSCALGLPLSASFVSMMRQVMLPVDFFFSPSLFLESFLFIGGVMLIGNMLPVYMILFMKTE